MKLRILYYYFKTLWLQRSLDRAGLVQHQAKQLSLWKSKVLSKSRYLSQQADDSIMDKSKMMNHFDEWNTLGIKKSQALGIALKAEEDRDFTPQLGALTIGLSSGTSGFRGVFLVSPKERDLWSGVILAKVLPRPIWQKHQVAFFLRANSNLYETVKSRNIEFKYFDLSVSMNLHIEALCHYQPSLLIAPAQVLVYLAQSKVQIQPEKIVSVAEVLTPSDRKIIEEFFQQQVHEVYQCTEGLLATTCSRGKLHLNEEFVHFEREYLDENKTHFNPIVTDFTRSSQPIYRYKMNDILRVGHCDCPRSSQVIESIEGRLDDLFYREEQGRMTPIFPDVLRHVVLRINSDLEDYQWIQRGAQSFELKTRPHLGKEAQGQFIEKVKEIWGGASTVEFSALGSQELILKKRRLLNLWSRS